MIKVSDVIRESVNYINDTEHFRVNMEVVDSTISEEKKISFETVKLKFIDEVEMKFTAVGQDNNGVCKSISKIGSRVVFTQSGIEIGVINTNDIEIIDSKIKFIDDNRKYIYEICKIMLKELNEALGL